MNSPSPAAHREAMAVRVEHFFERWYGVAKFVISLIVVVGSWMFLAGQYHAQIEAERASRNARDIVLDKQFEELKLSIHEQSTTTRALADQVGLLSNNMARMVEAVDDTKHRMTRIEALQDGKR